MPSKRKVREHMEALGPWLTGPDRYPLILAAHDAFDPLWKSGLLERNTAYWHLSKELQVPPFFAHFGKMHPAHLRNIRSAVENITISIHERFRR